MNHYTRWLELKEQNPGKYARDIAGLMNISEAELAFALSRTTRGGCAAIFVKFWRRSKVLAKPNVFVVMNMQSMSKLVRSQTSI